MSRKLIFPLAGLIALALCILVTRGASADEDHGPHLVAATITFHTNAHSKAADTPIIVTIHGRDRDIARLDHFADDTEFKDSSTNGPYAIGVDRDVPRSLAEHTRTSVRIEPHGYENWTFNYTVVLTFSDNTEIRTQVNDVRLTGEQREVSSENR